MTAADAGGIPIREIVSPAADARDGVGGFVRLPAADTGAGAAGDVQKTPADAGAGAAGHIRFSAGDTGIDAAGQVKAAAADAGGDSGGIAAKAAAGELTPEQVDEAAIEQALYTAGGSGMATGIALPDVDLLVRTAGEMRVSNYLLWQISYAELWVTPTLWPDFSRDELFAAIMDYSARTRRFGALDPA